MKALILMTRIPIPGKTKTRLMEVFTANQCAEIHKSFLLDLFNMFNFIKDKVDIFITYTPDDSLSLIEDILPDYVHCFPQRGQTLGERMEKSIQYVLDKGYSDVILIGSDIPDIKHYELLEAFDLLEEKDICIGPTLDGGYYLIGMKTVYKELFSDDLKWGYKTVLEGTLDIANNLGLKVGLAAKHRDIDTKEDLQDFKNRIDNGEFKDEYSPLNTINFINQSWDGGSNVEKRIRG